MKLYFLLIILCLSSCSILLDSDKQNESQTQCSDNLPNHCSAGCTNLSTDPQNCGPDVNPPAVLAAEAPNDLTLRLSFDELLDPNNVNAVANYRVNAGAVPVASAVLEADRRTITLTLASRLTGAFTVSISGVRDLAGNGLAAGTTIDGAIRTEPILIDFGASATPTANGAAPDDPANFWNNVTDSIGTKVGGQVPNLVAVDNASTGIGLVILTRFNDANPDGTLVSAQFPQDAMRDSLFGNTELFSGLSNVFPSFKLTGLDPLQTYDFTFFASRMGVSDNRETGYTVTGSNTGFAALNVANNIDKVATVAGIVPSAAGEITISLAPTAANNNASHFTYLGTLMIDQR